MSCTIFKNLLTVFGQACLSTENLNIICDLQKFTQPRLTLKTTQSCFRINKLISESRTMTQNVQNGSVGAQPRGWAGRARQELKPKGLFVGNIPVPCLFHGIENICYAHRLESKGIENLSNPNPGQITGLSVRVGKRWGGEELGWFSRDGTPLVRSGQETILLKPVVQRNQRLTRG